MVEINACESEERKKARRARAFVDIATPTLVEPATTGSKTGSAGSTRILVSWDETPVHAAGPQKKVQEPKDEAAKFYVASGSPHRIRPIFFEIDDSSSGSTDRVQRSSKKDKMTVPSMAEP
ncbi:hypothetical protein JTB14_024777 [Gonioctena quinquepunctata]|nr:hypothetical protein JTB14_024777 [Gonioctena quinquepunctata]